MEKANYKDFLGKKVHIVMDRPMGVKHPKWNFIYPLNYGYVPNTISGDGAELDAYIIGVFEPLEEYEGKCIAAIHRLDDDDDKLIIVPGTATKLGVFVTRFLPTKLILKITYKIQERKNKR